VELLQDSNIYRFNRSSVSSFLKDYADLVATAETSILQTLGKADLEVRYIFLISAHFSDTEIQPLRGIVQVLEMMTRNPFLRSSKTLSQEISHSNQPRLL
jgi:hypothetical protein